MAEYLTSDSAFLNLATHLSNVCVVAGKPSSPVPAKFNGCRVSIPVYRVGFLRMENDEAGREVWAISFGTTLVIKQKMWDGILKSTEQPRNVTLLANVPQQMYNTDFRIYTYQHEADMQGDLVSVNVDATALFSFHTLGYGDIDAEIAEIVKRGNHVPG